MAYYFTIPHLGAGRTEVEGLSCYMRRLAIAHGCSEWQLARHLAAWWDHSEANESASQFPKIVITKNTIPICGLGSDVSKLVGALTLGTGVGTLRSASLLPLHGVVSRTSIGTLRTSRAWCPACYQEDAALGHDLYDRLTWAIAPITRCPAHHAALQDRCPTCRSPQFYSVRFRLDECWSCGGSLASSALAPSRLEVPGFGEKLILDLVTACAEKPELALNHESVVTFFRRNRHELPRGDPLLNSRTLNGTGLPSLWTLLRMATAFNVSLLDFQTAEPPQGSLPLFGSHSHQLPTRKRSRLSNEVKTKVHHSLDASLASPQTPPPFSLFCKMLAVSPGYVSYQFPELTRSYLARRKSVVRGNRAEMLRAAQVAVDSGLLRRYEIGEIHQLKDLVLAVAEAVGVSIVTARKAIALSRSSKEGELDALLQFQETLGSRSKE